MDIDKWKSTLQIERKWHLQPDLDVAIYSNAIWTVQCTSNLRTTEGNSCTWIEWQDCLVYLDDAVVFESTVDELLQQFCTVFEKLRGAGFKLSPKKCQLFQKEVHYLGFLISEKGLAADPETTNATATRPVPKNIHEIRSFLGLCSYYQRFVKRFAQITKPLNLLTEFQTTFHRTSECQQVF